MHNSYFSSAMNFFNGLSFLMFASSMNGFLNWVENHLLQCPFKALTNIDCPGCGVQRSLISFFQGDLVNSFKYFPATIPMLFLIILTIFHLKFELKNGAFLIKIAYVGISAIIVINYIYKIFTAKH